MAIFLNICSYNRHLKSVKETIFFRVYCHNQYVLLWEMIILSLYFWVFAILDMLNHMQRNIWRHLWKFPHSKCFLPYSSPGCRNLWVGISCLTHFYSTSCIRLAWSIICLVQLWFIQVLSGKSISLWSVNSVIQCVLPFSKKYFS